MKSIRIGLAGGFALFCAAAFTWGVGASQDTDFWTEAAEGGLAEVALSNVALQKTQNDSVKQFAQTMVTDHTKANQDLSQLAVSKSVTIPTALSDKRQKDVSDLTAEDASSFDRKYLQMMVKDHERAVRLFERQSERGTDAELKAFATSLLPSLRAHLSSARSLNETLRGGGGDRSNSSNVNRSTNVRQDVNRNPNRNNNTNANGNSNSNGNANSNSSNRNRNSNTNANRP